MKKLNLVERNKVIAVLGLVVACVYAIGVTILLVKERSVEKVNVNQEYAKIIEDATDKLQNTYTDYIVSTSISAPDGDVEFLEVQHGNVNYTDYSVDEEGNYGTIGYATEDTVSYALTDWIDSDGTYYMYRDGADGTEAVFTLPKEYTNMVKDRSALYMHDILGYAVDIQKYDDMTMNIGEGEENFTSYKIKIKGDKVKEILGSNSYAIYKSLLDSNGKDSNIGKLCGYYLEDLNMNLTFSDANIIVGIDSNNILRYMSLETGGLGTRMYYTKVVVSTKNQNVRETPDFSTAVPFELTLTDMADFVSSYDTYDDAVSALNEWMKEE